MAHACEALGVPIVSGNVSLYNDTDGRSIHPTPVVGCVGLVPDVRRVPRGWQRGRRDPARPLAGLRSTLAGSEAQARCGARSAAPPTLDLAVRGGARPLRRRAPRRARSLVHDVAEGGLAVALAEAALWSRASAPSSTSTTIR